MYKSKINIYYTPTHRKGAILQSPCLFVRPSVRLSVRSHFRNRYLSFYWKRWFYIWYVALAWWLLPCLPFPGLLDIYFLLTVWLRSFHVCHNENFRNRYLSFYCKKWFYNYIWYMALAWWLVKIEESLNFVVKIILLGIFEIFEQVTSILA